MAFDNTDPVQVQELNTEVFTDPVNMGYINAPVSVTAALLDYLNNPTRNTGPGDSARDLDDVTVSQIAEIIDQIEYAALAEYDKEWVKAFIAQPEEVSIRDYKSKFLAIFPNGTTTRNNAIALLTVPDSSRAQHLWGWDTTITEADWFAAREA